jgi:hypothetical protein
MSRNEDLVGDAIFQIQNLEESLKKNAKGILSSTMKEEIKSLVKESLKEEDEIEDEEVETEVPVDTDNADEVEDVEDETPEDESEEDLNAEFDNSGIENDNEEEVAVNMTRASDSELYKVFSKMGPNDGIEVVKDDNMLHLKDTKRDAEYFIQLSESMEDEDLFEMDDEMFEMEDEDLFEMDDTELYEDEDEFEMEDEELFEFDEDGISQGDVDDIFSEGSETIYELELDDEIPTDLSELDIVSVNEFDDEELFEMEDEMFEMDDEELFEMDDEMFEMEDEELFEMDDEMFEMDDTELYEDEDEDEYIAESSKFKSKGVGMGSASKYRMSKKPNMEGGFRTVKKKVNKTMGTGKAKFEYKEERHPKNKMKKVETKEASRTYGAGNKFRNGGLPKPKAHSKNNTAINEEVTMLRQKNNEYKKALDLFRNKLNEVAVFNSNLAYSTRLFTEHSTTKQEKINIIKRFDGAETMKESKNLYRTIKNELTNGTKGENTISESFERTVNKVPSTGSAVSLIESKTYENPQFLRMKDLMTKIK